MEHHQADAIVGGEQRDSEEAATHLDAWGSYVSPLSDRVRKLGVAQ